MRVKIKMIFTMRNHVPMLVVNELVVRMMVEDDLNVKKCEKEIE